MLYIHSNSSCHQYIWGKPEVDTSPVQNRILIMKPVNLLNMGSMLLGHYICDNRDNAITVLSNLRKLPCIN